MQSRSSSIDETVNGLDIEALSTTKSEDLKQGEVVCDILQEVHVDEGETSQRQRRQEIKGKKLAWLENGLEPRILGFCLLVGEVDRERLKLGKSA
jgi:hypothetical protein